MMLLFDIGNTRIKCARVVDDTVDFLGAWSHIDNSVAHPLQIITTMVAAPERVVIANVAPAELLETVKDWVQATWGIQAKVLSSTAAIAGVRSSYAVAADLGIDRLAAMVAAFHQLRGPVGVVSCGSAVTIDVVDAAGQHLGGLIVPGYAMLLEMIATRTRGRLQGDVVFPATGQHLGTSTTECLSIGCQQMLTDCIDANMRRLTSDHGFDMQWLFSGGDADRILRALDIGGQYDPHLVLKGMLIMVNA